MKKRNLFFILGIIFSCFVLSIGIIKTNKDDEKANAYVKQAFIDWDWERKMIFAYQNSLIIEAEGEGTTVYLDAPEGWVWGTALATGDGLLGDEDLSLAELYQKSTASYTEEAPADGSDLSEWSIIFGSENPFTSTESQVVMNVVMNGGKLKTIYAGHASYQAESGAYLNGQVVCTVNGGEIGTLYTDSGYVEKDVGKAEGSKNISFYLNGGTINKLIRSDDLKLTYSANVYVKNNVKLMQIDYRTFSRGTKISLAGNLSNEAVLNVDLANEFSRSDVLFNAEDESYVELFNLGCVSLLNAPSYSSDWKIYKNGKSIRFGYDEKISSVEIVGSATVGETLTLKITPQKATASTISWYRKDDFLDVISWVAFGESYTLKNEDGGKLIYAVAVDKNDVTKRFTYEIATHVERVYLPEILTTNGKTTVYANGNDLLVAGSGTKSTIYIDKGTIGTLDNADVSLSEANIENAFENNSDLRAVCISAGSNLEVSIGELSITMLGGQVAEINTISNNEEKTNGDVLINLKGGKVGIVNAPKSKSNDDTLIHISGNVATKIYGIQHENAPTSIRIKGTLTCPNGSVVVVIDDDFASEGTFIVADKENYLDSSKFKIVKNNGSDANSLKLTKSDYTFKITVVTLDGADILGRLKLGKILKLDLNPSNAFYKTIQWYRSSSDSFDGVEKIENATGLTYKLTSEDLDKYIFVVVDEGLESEQIFMTNGIIKKGLPAWAIVLIVFASVIVALVVAFVIWFVLWKKEIAKAGFMKTIFERIGKKTQ